MAKGTDYKIKKIEKGPLARFKNQNVIIKKFGETGLQVYKAITGKRSTEELKKDLGVDDALFTQIMTFMQESGMVELEPVSSAARAPPAEKPPEEAPAEEAPAEEAPPEEKSELETLPPPEESEEDIPPLEEAPPPRKKKKEEEFAFEEIRPLDIETETASLEKKQEGKTRPSSRRKRKTEEVSDEISPVDDEITPVVEEEAPAEEPEEASSEEIPTEEAPSEEGVPSDESEGLEVPSGGTEEEGIETPTGEEEISISAFEEEAKPEPESELSPVEKIIFEKYGDVGLRAYSLIDGQRTAEEIMRETGLTEAKLVEMLDFMDEQGIIKLDYPKGGSGNQPPAGPSEFGAPSMQFGGPTQAAPQARKEEPGGFGPMIEGEDSLDEARAVPSPVEVPLKAPLDIVRSVQMKAKMMLKYGDKGAKISESVDGKTDVLDISLKLNYPLYEVYDILRFMMENGMLIMKPLSRVDVRKKYGDDGYSVYKRYGKEGLMLYELIGKEMTIQQMADKITKDKAKIVDMFIFIHKVLGIELPIDRDMLAKQLGVTNLPPLQ
jgi:hypothetical protein